MLNRFSAVAAAPTVRHGLAALIFVVCDIGHAASPSAEVESCLRFAAAKHNLNYLLLRAIAEQESSFNPNAGLAVGSSINANGTKDHGLMQINSTWFPLLASYGITPQNIYNPCINADVGAWILSENFKRMGLTWDAVGAYNARTHWKRVKYANGVYTRVMRSVPAAPAVR